MSKHTLSPTLQRLGIVLRAQRVFRLTYYCEACPLEWTDEALAIAHGYCPCCDAKLEPGTIEEFVEERHEFDLPEIE